MENNITKKNIWLYGAALVALDLLSFIAYTTDYLTLAATVVIILFSAIGLKNYPLSLVILATELIVGSQGYLYKFDFGGNSISIRLAIFFIAMAIFLLYELQRKDFSWIRTPVVQWWALSFLAIIWSAILGWLNNDFSNWFLDLNGYLFIFIFLPLYRYRHDWIPLFRSYWQPAILWLATKTLLLFYFYSHYEADILEPVYHWIRNTGWGEITFVSGNIFRIFSQSQIFLLIGAVVLSSAVIFNNGSKKLINTFGVNWIIGCLVIWSALLASLSRSFWLGGLVALLTAALLLLFIKNISGVQKLKNLFITSVIIISASGLVLGLSQFPIPKPLSTGENFLAQRVTAGTQEAAGASRLLLLWPLWDSVSKDWLAGAGFGATVTYRSLDPRFINSTAGGEGLYTTYAFEWGYLDIWLKMGLLGMILYFWWWLRVGFSSFRSIKYNEYRRLILLAVLAVAVANMTTPYLNHPLGIGALTILLLLSYHESEFKQAV